MIFKGGLLLLLIFILFFVFKWLYFGIQDIETPYYQESKIQQKISVRHYPSLNIAKIDVEGSQQSALKKGFRAVAAYIFGENAQYKKITMTKPVLLTGKLKNWQVAFIMPQKYDAATLPLPNNSNVELTEMKKAKYLVIRFSGRIRKSRLSKELKQLEMFATSRQCQIKGEPIYAFYNPPWTLPMFRRNEVWLRIEGDCF